MFCSYDCGVELGLRAGSSRIIRQQLFALVTTYADVIGKKEGLEGGCSGTLRIDVIGKKVELEEGVLKPPCRLSIWLISDVLCGGAGAWGLSAVWGGCPCALPAGQKPRTARQSTGTITAIHHVKDGQWRGQGLFSYGTETAVSLHVLNIVSPLFGLVVWCNGSCTCGMIAGLGASLTRPHTIPRTFTSFRPTTSDPSPKVHTHPQVDTAILFLYLCHSERQSVSACIMWYSGVYWGCLHQWCIMGGVTDGLRCVADCAGGGSCGLENFR